ncbi:PorV/PorQ family protein [candidate division KSB1 bacterium]|nr:PorV/PorQ family protein [candidate division KSB1 bacterium]RQW05757.1 MAG: PorV/PorQ family protein [candidate division KSB1 bacterium]
MKKYFTSTLVLFVVCSAFSYSPGTSGFQFLKMQVGARAAGMGGAFIAVPGDVNSLFYNPAGISVLSKKSASFSYHDDVLDINSGFMGYVHPKVGPGNIGVSVLYRDYGSFTRTDSDGLEQGTFGSTYFSLVGSYGLQLRQNVLVGGSLKYAQGMIDNYSSSAIAADAGIMYTIPTQHLILAAGVYNAGATLSAFVDQKDPLPMQMRVGLSKRLAHLPLLLGFNIYKYNDEPWYFAIGGEFTITPNIFLRWGYDSFGRDLDVDSSKDTLAGAAVGFGFLWKNITFDYSYSSLGALGSLNRFTLSGRF